MQDFAELLRGIAALVWPIAVIVFIFAFRTEIGGMLGRLRRAKVLGQEVELEKSLDRLEQRAEALEEERVAPSPPEDRTEASPEEDESTRRLLEESARSPRVGLMLLSAEIEHELRLILASQDQLREGAPMGMRGAARAAAKLGKMPPGSLEAVDEFAAVRNAIVHGSRGVSDAEILRAIDSGLAILKALQSIPRELHVVYHPGVEVYADPEGKEIREDVRAVILESRSPETGHVRRHAVPSTQTHFRKGKAVAWQWNAGNRWGESWYRDPDTGEVQHGWTSAIEFVGRHLDEI